MSRRVPHQQDWLWDGPPEPPPVSPLDEDDAAAARQQRARACAAPTQRHAPQSGAAHVARGRDSGSIDVEHGAPQRDPPERAPVRPGRVRPYPLASGSKALLLGLLAALAAATGGTERR